MNRFSNPDLDDQDFEQLNQLSNSDSPSSLPITFLSSNPELDDLIISDPDPSCTYQSQSTGRKKKAGRIKNEFTKILERFYTPQNKHPKKECFNAFSIRAIKRAIKNSRRGQVPKKTCIKVDIDSDEKMTLWYHIDAVCRRNIREAGEILKLNPGKGNDRGYKSFTNEFCKEFYGHPITRQIFSKLLGIYYFQATPEDLCRIFKLHCCSTRHSDTCTESWMVLREYLRRTYITDIGMCKKKESGWACCLNSSQE